MHKAKRKTCSALRDVQKMKCMEEFVKGMEGKARHAAEGCTLSVLNALGK